MFFSLTGERAGGIERKPRGRFFPRTRARPALFETRVNDVRFMEREREWEGGRAVSFFATRDFSEFHSKFFSPEGARVAERRRVINYADGFSAARRGDLSPLSVFAVHFTRKRDVRLYTYPIVSASGQKSSRACDGIARNEEGVAGMGCVSLVWVRYTF